MKPVRELRKSIPLRVKLQAALLAAGFTYEEVTTQGAIHFDHDPALGLREQKRKGATIVFVPDQLDPRHIVPRSAEPHKVKTNGSKATCADGDTHKIAKARRLSAEQEAFRKQLLKGTPGKRQAAKQRTKSKWPQGRKIRSKP